MPRVGLIDSGVSNGEAENIAALCSFPRQGNDVVTNEDQADDGLGHGSRVAEIITTQQPGISLYVARVFFEKLVTTPAQIVAALNWLVTQRVKLINMSFGLTANRDILKTACDRAQQAGIILVAAAPARGGPVYPAGYPGVIRATGDARCRPGEISWLHTEQADFGGYVRSAGDTINGASIGCAHVSAAITLLLTEYPGIAKNEIIHRLGAGAGYTGPEKRCE